MSNNFFTLTLFLHFYFVKMSHLFSSNTFMVMSRLAINLFYYMPEQRKYCNNHNYNSHARSFSPTAGGRVKPKC